MVTAAQPTKNNADSIDSTLIERLKKKNILCRKLICVGFDGAASLAGKKLVLKQD